LSLKFSRSAKIFLQSQPANIVSKLIDDCAELTDNPHLTPGDPRKAPFFAPPVFMRIFRDTFHWIIYYVENDIVLIANIGMNGEEPHLYRKPID